MPEGRPPGESRLLQLVYYAYVAGSRLALALPEAMAYGLARSLGSLQWRLSRKKRSIVERNLARITGLDEGSDALAGLSREAFRSYARYWLETFRLVREGPDFFLEHFRSTGEDKIDDALARGQGVVVAVSHLGNWDAAGAWVGARGQTLVTVAEVLRPRRMFDFFVAHRARLGMVIHAAESGVTSKLVTAASNGAVVAVLADRDLKGTGPEVVFFGEPVTFPPGAASVALRAGVPLLVAGVFSTVREDGRHGWIAEIVGPFEPSPEADDPVADLTRQVAGELERFVAKHPEEWHVFQPFWSADRGP